MNKNQFLTLNALSHNRGPDMSGYWTNNVQAKIVLY